MYIYISRLYKLKMDKNSYAASASNSETTPMLIDANESDEAVTEVRFWQLSVTSIKIVIIRMLRYCSVSRNVHSSVHSDNWIVHRHFDEFWAVFNILYTNKHN